MDVIAKDIETKGFSIIHELYSKAEVQSLLSLIQVAEKSNTNFRQSKDLFAIRRFLKEIPEVQTVIFNHKLRKIIEDNFGQDYFITKSIYFDKPEQSNWFVAYHQDLTISVDKKIEDKNYCNWTVKQNQFSVQPPLSILENSFTIRIHLDDTDESNGALKVIEESHTNGIQRVEEVNLHKEVVCKVPAGGMMVMNPLLLHSSRRSTGDKQRRVIHIELCNQPLPGGLNWAEYSVY